MSKDFFSRASMGFLRVAVVVPELRVADVHYNTRAFIEALERAADHKCQIVLFPELCMTGYSCADLFYQSLLLRHARSALLLIANADQMSMYHVNAGVPKTLVRYLIEWCADSLFTGETADVLRNICATPITPELLPPGEREMLQQETEETVGPYLLHDFFLFHTVRYACSPHKVLFLVRRAFDTVYTPEEILHWMQVFYQRFFAYQFKRSAMPDGPKVGSVTLSPRGDWRMPSDGSLALWQEELEDMILSLLNT